MENTKVFYQIKMFGLGLIFDIICFMINLLPLKVTGFLGRRLGDVIKLLGLRREVARDNLEKALKENPEIEQEIDIETVLQECYRHFGQVAMEFLLLKGKQGELKNHHNFAGEEHLQTAYEQGNGVIIYTAHYGNWEWLGSVLAEKGYPVTAIARTQKQAVINRRINKLRQIQGVNLVADSNSGVREAIRQLKSGDLLIILGDQHAPHGLELDFLNRKASVFAGAMQMASRYQAPLIPAFSVRKSFASFRIELEAPIMVPENIDRQAEKYWLEKLLELTEAKIIAHPEQWLWMHKRWKLD